MNQHDYLKRFKIDDIDYIESENEESNIHKSNVNNNCNDNNQFTQEYNNLNNNLQSNKALNSSLDKSKKYSVNKETKEFLDNYNYNKSNVQNNNNQQNDVTKNEVLKTSKLPSIKNNKNINNNNNNMQEDSESQLNNNDKEENRYHHIQIIDEDVENFKRRLDILTKNFKTDTLNDFMSIKRNLLLEQKSVIDNEKQRTEAIITTKNNQIENLKESLAHNKNTTFNQIEIKENLAKMLYNIKNKNKLNKLKDIGFKLLKDNFLFEKKSKRITNIIQKKIINYNIKKNVFSNVLKKFYYSTKAEKAISEKEMLFKSKLNEVSIKYNKEVNDLKNKLDDANNQINKYKEQKNQIQENLKKTLMRNVVAMNFEAMNILDNDNLDSILNNNNNNNNNNNATNLSNIDNNISNSNVPAFNNNLDNYNVNNKYCEKKNINDNNSFFTNKDNNINNNNNNNSNNYINNNCISYNSETYENKVVSKDSNWVNASTVSNKIKNEILYKPDKTLIDESTLNKSAYISDNINNKNYGNDKINQHNNYDSSINNPMHSTFGKFTPSSIYTGSNINFTGNNLNCNYSKETLPYDELSKSKCV